MGIEDLDRRYWISAVVVIKKNKLSAVVALIEL